MSPGARALVGLPVEVESRRLGRVVDVILDRSLRQLIGLDVRDTRGVARFLPAPAATLATEAVATPTAFALLDRTAVGFYDECGIRLGELVRLPWLGAGVTPGARLADATLLADGGVEQLVLWTGSRLLSLEREGLRVQLEFAGSGFALAAVHVSSDAVPRGRRAAAEVSPALPGVPLA